MQRETKTFCIIQIKQLSSTITECLITNDRALRKV